MLLKGMVKKALAWLNIDLTKNMEYDRLTNRLMRRFLKPDSNCIDIGSHRGEVLSQMLKYAPEGQHYAFEPIPELFRFLQKKYSGKANILPYALAEKEGISTFHYVKNAPAFSGLKKRKYHINNPEIQKLEVNVKTLDQLLPEDLKIDLIKIDVEGAEFPVLKGAKRILRKSRPLVIFEFGLGASDYYNTDPDEFYKYLTEECRLNIFPIKDWFKNGTPLKQKEFKDLYQENKEYYYLAKP